MMCGDYTYIWQDETWPHWRYDLAQLAGPLAEVSRLQGHLIGRLADLGMELRDQASLAVLTEDVVKTSEIEGEFLNVESVRSSIARRLGVDIGALAPVDRHVDGVVEMVLDATTNPHATLTSERLFGWHAALFPTGYSGLSKIKVGGWRDDAGGPMQVVSGPIGRQRVHFEAPPPKTLIWKCTGSSIGSMAHRLNLHCSRPVLGISGLSPCTRSTTAMVVLLGQSVTCSWHAPTEVHNAFIACRHKFSGNVKPTTISWSRPRKEQWMSQSGFFGSLICCIARSTTPNSHSMMSSPRRDFGNVGQPCPCMRGR